MSNIFLKPTPAQIRAVDEAIQEEPVDVILIESMFIGAVGILSKLGILARVRNIALDVLTKKLIFDGVQRQAEKIILDTTGKKLDGFFMSGASRADAIVQFTVPEFEFPRSDLPDTVHFVGPMSRVTPSSGELPD